MEAGKGRRYEAGLSLKNFRQACWEAALGGRAGRLCWEGLLGRACWEALLGQACWDGRATFLSIMRRQEARSWKGPPRRPSDDPSPPL